MWIFVLWHYVFRRLCSTRLELPRFYSSSNDRIGLQLCVSWAFLACSPGGSPLSPRTRVIGRPMLNEQPALKWTEIGSQFTICATANIARKSSTRIVGATAQSTFHKSGPPTYS